MKIISMICLQYKGSKFRCRSVSKLPVEAGCYTNISYYGKICDKCDRNDIGDEYQYVLICIFFRQKEKNLYLKLLSQFTIYVQIYPIFEFKKKKKK